MKSLKSYLELNKESVSYILISCFIVLMIMFPDNIFAQDGSNSQAKNFQKMLKTGVLATVIDFVLMTWAFIQWMFFFFNFSADNSMIQNAMKPIFLTFFAFNWNWLLENLIFKVI